MIITTFGADTLTERHWCPLQAAGRATIINQLTTGYGDSENFNRRNPLEVVPS